MISRPAIAIEFNPATNEVQGQIIEVECDSYYVREGVLTTYMKGGSMGQYGERNFPLTGIREYRKLDDLR
jgi:hypothetical protein